MRHLQCDCSFASRLHCHLCVRCHGEEAMDASPEVQSALIKAAAKAGVPWILPNEYGSDGGNLELSNAVSMLEAKAQYRKEIEELGRSSWIGIACSLWFDFV